MRGWIWDVRRYTLHDGPGIRTTVFFKGCPLGCLWCANPEAQAPGPELLWIKERCLACDLCRDTCPRWAINIGRDGEPCFDRETCDLCGLCAAGCPSEAMNLVGREMDVDEVMQEVTRDEPFHTRSGGGLTLSGGEPLMQPAFAAAILERYKVEERGRHTAVETSGHAPWEAIAAVAPFTDVFLYDVKHIDSDEHRRLTGVGNELILENARRLTTSRAAVVIRLPLVPGCNDGDDNLRRTAGFVRSLEGAPRVDVLPFHRLGEPKYARLGRAYPLAGTRAPSDEALSRARAIIAETGLRVRIGG